MFLIRSQIILVLVASAGIPLFLHPSDGVFGRFDLAALLRLPHLQFFLFLLNWGTGMELTLSCSRY